ncbi:hypothetical protein [Burkholderia sp. Ac-20353]|uniref:hypothetical protein n=1 Tax=Burkholderia sp. Ac-20353 TaxID=2703894 RepID=UPI00197B9638|nr:hypothetical protein [Burkholderia sp. Ac-20353]MBN3787583.1 hypothetical protein [Burkholderia sp. Ac-20353]
MLNDDSARFVHPLTVDLDFTEQYLATTGMLERRVDVSTCSGSAAGTHIRLS